MGGVISSKIEWLKRCRRGPGRRDNRTTAMSNFWIFLLLTAGLCCWRKENIPHATAAAVTGNANDLASLFSNREAVDLLCCWWPSSRTDCFTWNIPESWRWSDAMKSFQKQRVAVNTFQRRPPKQADSQYVVSDQPRSRQWVLPRSVVIWTEEPNIWLRKRLGDHSCQFKWKHGQRIDNRDSQSKQLGS